MSDHGPRPTFGKPAEEWHASQGPYLDDLTPDERRAAEVMVRCDDCREIVSILTAGSLVTRTSRVTRDTHGKTIMADCRRCPDLEPRAGHAGHLVLRHWDISTAKFWHLMDFPSEVPPRGITRSLLAP